MADEIPDINPIQMSTRAPTPKQITHEEPTETRRSSQDVASAQ